MMRLILQVWKKTTRRIGVRLMWAVSLNVCHCDRRHHHPRHHPHCHHPRHHHHRQQHHHHHNIIIIIIIIIIIVIVTLLVQHAHIDSQITEHHSQHVRLIDRLNGAVTGALRALRALSIVASRLLAHKNKAVEN